LANIQSLSNSTSFTSQCWYAYDEQKFACYSNFPNGTTNIQLYRYDKVNCTFILLMFQKVLLQVEETPNQNGVNIVCRNSTLSGSLFTPQLLSSFSYKGDSYVQGVSASTFYVSLPWYLVVFLLMYLGMVSPLSLCHNNPSLLSFEFGVRDIR
jgi:hypothetical protein